jgi:hypothetical protein
MTRHWKALTALGAVSAMTAMISSTATAVTPHRATTAAGSIALFGAQLGDFQVVKGLSGTTPHKTALLDVSTSRAWATSINPAKGNDGLLCLDSGTVYPVHRLRTAPALQGTPIDASGFTGEGGSGYGFFCDGNAVHGSFGLATGDSQGLLQLARKNGTWKVDTRVQSPGLNEANQPHKHGWINFPNALTGVATEFNNVVIAPRPLANGKFLAVAIDRSDQTLVVVTGVGTATPHAAGVLSGAALANLTVNDGNTGIAFLPSSPNRAVIVTKTGFAALDLRKPSDPRLRNKKTVGTGTVEPSSISVSSDGDHLAVSAGKQVYGYSNVIAGVTQGKSFHLQTSFHLGTSGTEAVDDVAYTADDTLVVLHGDSASAPDWFLTLVRKVPAGHHQILGSTSTTMPEKAGSLSVWPAP